VLLTKNLLEMLGELRDAASDSPSSAIKSSP
jgi:hypothetical protein